jgi:hypothetical protein
VKKFEDVKGKKIATAGAALQWLRGTGATPVQSNMTLYYNSPRPAWSTASSSSRPRFRA